MNPNEAKTEKEYMDAVELEQAEEEFHKLMRMASYSTSDGARKFASAKLRGLYGVGDYLEADAGEEPKH